jgi:tocopherol O-methyltransferase
MDPEPTFTHELTEAVRAHYDRVSPLYHRFWGEHIHHGYWQNGESVSEAQRRLIEKMAEVANVGRGARVLDVGCGLGGSSLWLARNLGCSVEGLTISPVQQAIASRRAKKMGISDAVHFKVADANDMVLADPPFDVVWVIECSEHLYDKRRFIRTCHGALGQDGALAVCAWVDKGDSSPEHRGVISAICDSMVCPSLGRFGDYESWMREAGFPTVDARDISDRVARTWDACARIAERKDVQTLAKTLDGRTRRFVQSFGLMQKAYRAGILGYGMFVARR